MHPEPPNHTITIHTDAAPADFPKSFPTVAEAVTYLQGRVGFVSPALADKVVAAAVSDVMQCNEAVVGWGTKPARPLRSTLAADAFPRKASYLVALRYVVVGGVCDQ